jgi:B12-binding domain/radical SAM domain protein
LQAGFDWVALGEGELVIRAVARGEPLERVQGLARLVDGKLSSTARGPLVELDGFPPFAAAHRRFGPIEITRGCVYACKFCQTPFFNHARFRHRSVPNVRQHVETMVARDLRDVRFLSPTSLSYGASSAEPNLDAVEELLASVRELIGPARRLYFGTFPSEVRPEHVTPRALAIVKRFCDNRTLILGGQSGSDAVLAHSKRGHDVAAIERAVACCLELGFTPHVDFLLGLPGEAEADAQATLALMQRLAERGAKAHAHVFMPLPGTPFRREAAGTVSAVTELGLRRLASRGALYGQWERQRVHANELVRLAQRG